MGKLFTILSYVAVGISSLSAIVGLILKPKSQADVSHPTADEGQKWKRPLSKSLLWLAIAGLVVSILSQFVKDQLSAAKSERDAATNAFLIHHTLMSLTNTINTYSNTQVELAYQANTLEQINDLHYCALLQLDSQISTLEGLKKVSDQVTSSHDVLSKRIEPTMVRTTNILSELISSFQQLQLQKNTPITNQVISLHEAKTFDFMQIILNLQPLPSNILQSNILNAAQTRLRKAAPTDSNPTGPFLEASNVLVYPLSEVVKATIFHRYSKVGRYDLTLLSPDLQYDTTSAFVLCPTNMEDALLTVPFNQADQAQLLYNTNSGIVLRLSFKIPRADWRDDGEPPLVRHLLHSQLVVLSKSNRQCPFALVSGSIRVLGDIWDIVPKGFPLEPRLERLTPQGFFENKLAYSIARRP